MGLGKTLQSIALLFTLLNMSPHKARGGEVQKVIIVCPATLLNNWNKEFTKCKLTVVSEYLAEESSVSLMSSSPVVSVAGLGSHRCKPVLVTARYAR
jgi:hypothetical protein